MITDLKKEMTSFLHDIEKNIQNKEDLLYLKERVAKLFDIFMNELEAAYDYKKEELDKMEQRQNMMDERLEQMHQKIEAITKDIYDEDDDFEIICPYCNHEFDADIDEDTVEVECPECNNLIELDWGIDEDKGSSCGGNCSGCNGCE